LDRTTLVQQPNGNLQWWTFAGGLANTLVVDHLGGEPAGRPDNLCIRFPMTVKLSDLETRISARMLDEIVSTPVEF
jgi:hypothetical protein